MVPASACEVTPAPSPGLGLCCPHSFLPSLSPQGPLEAPPGQEPEEEARGQRPEAKGPGLVPQTQGPRPRNPGSAAFATSLDTPVPSVLRTDEGKVGPRGPLPPPAASVSGNELFLQGQVALRCQGGFEESGCSWSVACVLRSPGPDRTVRKARPGGQWPCAWGSGTATAPAEKPWRLPPVIHRRPEKG